MLIKFYMEQSSSVAFSEKIFKKSMWRKLLRFKWFYLFGFLLAMVAFYYFWRVNDTAAETRYILSAAAKGTIISMISGTGQISASNQIDIIPAASGDILELNVIAGQKVKAGEIIARLDDSEAQAQVRQTQNSLASARASLASKLAGLTQEEILVSQKTIEASKMSFDNAVKNLEYVEQANTDSLDKAQLQVENATLNLQSAQRNYDNAVSSSGLSSLSDTNNLSKAYNDAKNNLASAIISLRSAIVSADNILEKNNYNSSGHNYKDYLGVRNSQSISTANSAYESARSSFQDLESAYNIAAVAWDKNKIETLLSKTQETAGLMQSLSTAISNLLINSITSSNFSQSTLDAYKQTASSQESAMVSLNSSLQSSVQSLNSANLNSSSTDISINAGVDSAKAALESAQNNLISAKNSLKQTEFDNQKNLDSANNELASRKNSYESSQAQFNLKMAKPRAVDLTPLYLQISTAEVNHQESLDNLAETEVKAPIDGIIAQVNKKAGDSVRDSDAGDTLATIITEEKLALISLNEVDAAKVKVGQKANITLSAIEDLNITGSVVEIESIASVSQGVVSYNVKIVLDAQDERIKPQMTVSADIAIAQSVDVLTVPNAAIQTDIDGNNYVEVLDYQGEPAASGVISSSAPINQVVVIGISDESNTEIKNGLSESAWVVVKTIVGSNADSSVSTKKSATSILGGGMGGGRMPGL